MRVPTLSPDNPIVFLDIAVGKEKMGRVVIELFKHRVPRTAENFRALCTGERGLGNKGKPLHYKGCFFHKVVPWLMAQGGDIINFDGSSGECIYEGFFFEDEDLTQLHNEEGLLSMVNEGMPNSNSSQFVITMATCPQLNNTNVIFGKVLKGLGIIKELSNLPATNDIPHKKVCIINCGELTGCYDWCLEDNDGEDVYTPYPEDGNYSPKTDNLTYENLLDIVKKIKNVGNAYFAKKKYTTAENKYQKALRYHDWIKKHDIEKNDKEMTELRKLMLLNLAAVKLHKVKYRDALKLCNEVLAMDENNCKALFRRSQAHMGLNEYEMGLADLKEARRKSPNNKEILKEMEKVKRIMKNYFEFEKKTCKRIFQMY